MPRRGRVDGCALQAFRDKLEILKAIVEQGFDRMAERSLSAVRAKGEGTIDGVIAMGQATSRLRWKRRPCSV